MTNIAQAVADLVERDVGFFCRHPHYTGHSTVWLSPEELLSYAQDPVGYLASYYGVSNSDYLAWHQSNYLVRCAGRTRAGKPCKNVVDGGHNVEPRRWAELQGSYCRVHQ